MKRKILFTVLTAVILSLFVNISVYAEGESSVDEVIPSEPVEQISNVTNDPSNDENTNTVSSYIEQSIDNSGSNTDPDQSSSIPDESSYAEPDNEYSTPDESSYTKPDNEYSNPDESIYTEPSDEVSDEDPQEPSGTSSTQSSDETSNASPVLRRDPFSWLSGINTVIPADRSGYISPAQKAENEKADKLYEESKAALEQAAKAERNLLTAPHIPDNDVIEDTASVAAQNESNSFLIGIIIWSAIGIIITMILIFIFRTKAPEKSFTRNPKR